jgi:hypothetical protein
MTLFVFLSNNDCGDQCRIIGYAAAYVCTG